MDINLRAGQRVLYKKNGSWKVGILPPGNLSLTTEGVFANVLDKNDQHVEKNVNVNSLYINSFELDEWMKDPDYCMPKQEFIDLLKSETVIIDKAYVSDGEYAYYPVNTFRDTWINKQPFDYIFISEFVNV